MNQNYTHREVSTDDLETICNFPQNETELFFMFPKAEYPLTVSRLKLSIDSRFNSTVILSGEKVVGFANFYEVVKDQYCTIGNLIINPEFRGKGAGDFLIKTMESLAVANHMAKEIHISCFNQNIAGLLLYNSLGYIPYEIEKRLDKNGVKIAAIKLKKTL